MSTLWFHLLDPFSRKPLHFTPLGNTAGFGYWADEEAIHRWPMALGISFLRADRVVLAEAVVELLRVGKPVVAVGRLLQDTDDFAPRIPELDDCEDLAARLLAPDDELSAREMMEALQFGPVADYFALRGSAPTFFSGLGLLKLGAWADRPLVEVGCGAGHFLHWLQARGVEAVGTDSVFSKLCLAHRFLQVPADHLLCAVAGKEAPLPLDCAGPVSVFCHDAFYFFEDKSRCLEDFRRLAGAEGSILVGHAHLATADHGKVSGFPLPREEYAQLATAAAHWFDDAALVAVGAGTGPLDREIPHSAEALSFLEGTLAEDGTDWWSSADQLLHAPMGLTWSPAKGRTQMDWPSEEFAREYRSADYLVSASNPFEHLPARGNPDPAMLHPGLAIPTRFQALGVQPLRWGIIGGGWIATDYFAPAFAYTPQAKLVGLADLRRERREAQAAVHGLRTFADWREMLAACPLDAVYIATPNDAHAEIFEGAAAAGLRVLCEKPLATNQPDLERMRHCSRHAPDFFQTAYDQRYHPAHLQLARRIAEGALGTVTQIRVHYACWVDGDWRKAEATENWRIDRRRAGGGAGFDLLPHCLDLVSVLVADSIVEAHLSYQSKVHDYAVTQTIDDGALLTLKTRSSILASIHVGYHCPEDQPRRRLEIMGTRGRVEALDTMGQDPGGELVWLLPTGITREKFPTGAEAGPFVRQLDAVSRMWLRGDVPPFSFQRDLTLAELLIRCDAQARANPVPTHQPA